MSADGIRTDRTRETLRNYYEEARRNDEFEPSWIHPFFVPVLDGAPLCEEHDSVASSLHRGEVQREEWFGQSRVIDRDGWKVGTSTWIFLRRKYCTPIAYNGWTIVHASFEGETFWLAYDNEHRVGTSTLTDESTGPCLTLDEAKRAIDAAPLSETYELTGPLGGGVWVPSPQRSTPPNHEALVRQALASLQSVTDFGFDPNDGDARAAYVSMIREGVMLEVVGLSALGQADGARARLNHAEWVAHDTWWRALWARSGFQHITFANPRLVASYAFTEARRATVGEDLPMPWPAFCVDFEPGALPIPSGGWGTSRSRHANGAGRLCAIRHRQIQRGDRLPFALGRGARGRR